MTPTATVTPIRPDSTSIGSDPKLEDWLTAHHVTFTYDPALDLGRIDERRSLGNQARLGDPLIDDVVDMYVVAYKRGDQFPPLLVRQTSAKAKLVTLDGNHRLIAAGRAGRNTHPAYVVTATDEAALTIMYEANAKHGAQLPRAQRIAQAVHLVEMGWQQDKAAATVGVSGPEVSTARKVAAAGRRLAAAKITGFDTLPGSTKVELARIDSTPRLAETTKLVVAAGLTGTDVKTVVERVRKADSDEAALQFIGAEVEVRRDDIQRRFGGKVGKPRKISEYTKAKNAAMELLTVTADEVASSCPTPDARTRLRAQLKDAARRCLELDKALR